KHLLIDMRLTVELFLPAITRTAAIEELQRQTANGFNVARVTGRQSTRGHATNPPRRLDEGHRALRPRRSDRPHDTGRRRAINQEIAGGCFGKNGRRPRKDDKEAANDET